MASSISCPSNWVYDVFPSFRGEDVRDNFLSHFLKEFDRKLIFSFKDNKIDKGQSLDPELREAIRTSRIAVVIFSENYPSSSWCLEEFMEIVECKKDTDQLVIPIFYGLDPSHVRKQTGKFGEAFNKTCKKRKREEETELLKESLTKVANLAGYHFEKGHSEADKIGEIANEVLAKLFRTTTNDSEDLVGMGDHIAKMSGLLNLESDEVRMVGIWGPSGIGKTTIARFLYSQLSRGFQASVYIDKAFVLKSVDSYKNANQVDPNMKLDLESRFLSEILDIKDIKKDRMGSVKQRLKNHKVLIVIDDVNDQMVLDTLAGQSQWFGCGSRIIVITKDKHLLRAHGIDHVYEVCLPSEKIAFEIFCRYAFRQNSPPEGMMEIVSQVAKRAGNLPLGLKVLGSYLQREDKKELIRMLPSLRGRLNGEIKITLRVSYVGLKYKKDKALFRHIACLFNGEKLNDIKLMLADSDLDVNIGLKSLVDKSLISVRSDVVNMHQLLEDMGKEIVREQSKKLGEREFLMDTKDIRDVLKHNKGTEEVLGIALNMDEIAELQIHENAFKGMPNLRFLKFYTWASKKQVRWHLPNGLDCFPCELRLLSFDGYPMRYMPFNFSPKFLVKLQMRGSKLERLWEGVHSLIWLKDIDLYGSRNLRELPDLSMATNLETLLLCGCSRLVEVPSSIKYLNKLVMLDMSFCKNLKTLPTGINLQSLDTLKLIGCSRLKTFPNISTNISTLVLDESAIDEFHSIWSLKKLIYLSMCQMKSKKLWEGEQTLALLMTMLPHSLKKLLLSHISSLVELPSSIQNFRKLKQLWIRDCVNLETLPTGINLPLLSSIDLSGCSRLRIFPNISTNITYINLDETRIEAVPSWIIDFYRLKQLNLRKCESLKRISLNTHKLKHLQYLDFSLSGLDMAPHF